MRPIMRLVGAGLLGVAAALLVACGATSNKLIPLANAGPLTSDVEAIEQAAKSGDGDCSTTETAITKAEHDYATLPSTLDAGLRNTLHQGIANLRTRALALCTQPLASTSTTKTSGILPKTTITTITTPAQTTPTPATTTPTVTTPVNPGPGGGTPAEEAGEEASGGAGEQGGTGERAGGAGAGGAGAGAGGDAGAGGAGAGGGAGLGVQEGGK
ncbi:MAG TPA: hypothetical protein VN892_13795 [Solirubrobacteraceae bacterium]|nr:hypothetical protein [Solirubrobacteraceae bacterium]